MAKNDFSSLENALNGRSAEETIRLLQKEGRRLERIARKAWQTYYASYSPKEYRRTYNANKALKLGRVKQISPFEYGIELTWENDLAYHPSVVGKSQPKGHAVTLISGGWRASKLKAKIGRDVYRFTYFEGTGYLEKVMSMWKSTAPTGIQIELQNYVSGKK